MNVSTQGTCSPDRPLRSACRNRHQGSRRTEERIALELVEAGAGEPPALRDQHALRAALRDMRVGGEPVGGISRATSEADDSLRRREPACVLTGDLWFAACNSSRLRPTATTRAPRSESRRMVALPITSAGPVTTATLPSRRMRSGICFLWSIRLGPDPLVTAAKHCETERSPQMAASDF